MISEKAEPEEAPTKDPAAGLAMLRQHLSEASENGATRVWLTDVALDQVSTLPDRARAAASRAQPHAPAPVEKTSDSDDHPAPQVGGDKASQLAALRDEAENCERCRALGSLRDTMVFAVGDPDASLMFVGEAPGYEEEKQREPFVGPAGQLLTKIIQTMGITREDVYISNIVKFRPSTGTDNQGTANRAPTAEEMEAAVGYVQREIEIVAPKLIIALGGTAMTGLLGLDGSVGRARGQLHNFEGTPTLVTYHPSYLLRSGQLSDKRKLWEDMLFAMEHLGLPISDKQRGFFLK